MLGSQSESPHEDWEGRRTFLARVVSASRAGVETGVRVGGGHWTVADVVVVGLLRLLPCRSDSHVQTSVRYALIIWCNDFESDRTFLRRILRALVT